MVISDEEVDEKRTDGWTNVCHDRASYLRNLLDWKHEDF